MNKYVKLVLDFYAREASRLNWVQSTLIGVLRLAWGIAFMQTGWGKLHNLPQVTEFFTSLGIPFPGANAAFVGSVEFLGGIFLALGLLSRLTALPLAITLVVAYLTADLEAVKSLFSADFMNFFGADPWPFLLVCLLVLAFGPGKLSLDAIVARKLQRKVVPTAGLAPATSAF
jgi:putative oxidoreductase